MARNSGELKTCDNVPSAEVNQSFISSRTEVIFSPLALSLSQPIDGGLDRLGHALRHRGLELEVGPTHVDHGVYQPQQPGVLLAGQTRPWHFGQAGQEGKELGFHGEEAGKIG